MRAFSLVIVVAVAVSGCALKPRSAFSKIALTTSIGCDAADLATTMYGVGSGQLRELNPILKPFQHNPLAFTAVKGSLGAVSNWGFWLNQDTHPTASTWALVANGTLKCLLAVRNQSLLRR